MKRKFSIALLFAIMATIFSFNVLAVEITEENMYDTMLISEDLEMDYISNARPGLIISPRPSNAIKVQLDGQYLDFTDENGNVVNPEILNDRTMVPMRKIFETFDADVKWDGTTRTVVATTLEKEITLTIDNEKAKVKNLETSEEKEIVLDAAPVILNDRTMVPVRFIAESLEKEVGWDSELRTVVIIDYDKLTKKLEEKAPALQKLFDIEVETTESFKTTSKITGKLTYKDPENKTNNETVEIDGNLELNMNKEKEMEMFFDIKFDGKGTIYNSLKEAGYEEMEFGIVIAEDNAYMMAKIDGKEMWQSMEDELDLSALDSLQVSASPKSYAEYMDTIKVSLGELDSTTYMVADQMIELFAAIFSEENLTVSETNSKKTVKLEMDLMELLGSLLGTAVSEVEDMEMKVTVVEKISNKKIDSAVIELEMEIKEPSTKENMELNLELDMKYGNINKDFDIKVPTITVER